MLLNMLLNLYYSYFYFVFIQSFLTFSAYISQYSISDSKMKEASTESKEGENILALAAEISCSTSNGTKPMDVSSAQIVSVSLSPLFSCCKVLHTAF